MSRRLPTDFIKATTQKMNGGSGIHLEPINTTTTGTQSTFSKWIPTLCATAAVGISIVALYELNNVRKELKNFKNDSVNNEISKKMELMEQQLNKITEYLTYKEEKKKEQIIKNAVPAPENINIINDEYEEIEVEVTDSESETEP